jgi:hypothetical protein
MSHEGARLYIKYMMGGGNDRALLSVRDEKATKSSGVMTLDQFIQQEERRIAFFRRWWILQNVDNPERFPMQMPLENAGIWNEMLDNFDPDNAEVPQ